MGPPMSLDPRVRDPYAVFRSSTTPAGLYARQKWLGESSTTQWKEDFAAAVADLVRGQSTDGLWRGSAIETIQRLFGLHLTVRHPDPCIEKGLDALLDIASAATSQTQPDFIQAERLHGLPFTPGPRAAILVPATLFLCTIFGRSTAPRVLAQYDRTVQVVDQAIEHREKTSWRHNLLRALVVNPRYTDHPAIRRIVVWLADHQTRQGHWGVDIPFYQTLNALAHLNTPAADRQTKRAIDHLSATQHADGSWGVSQRLWCTFLAVHALRNKGIVQGRQFPGCRVRHGKTGPIGGAPVTRTADG
jgi:hypothetical protein